MTVGEFISDVKNSVQAIRKDDRISNKFIHSLARDYTSYILSQRQLRDVFRDSTIFTEVTCVEMNQIRSDKCDVAEFRKCDKVMKSECKLPNIFNSSIGPIIISVSNITGETEYQALRTAADYKSQQKRQFQKATSYYYIANGHIYIVGSTPERISIVGLFEDQLEAEQFSACSEADSCESALDYKIIIPNKYISTVKDQVVQYLVKTRKSIPADENSDLDSNQKAGLQAK
jgi:hypothetical protein|tara:strand:- start:102 stop:794 length:693 start_codon:yes stop_codon:yes gene_type:complete